jgi:hypothetical protein
MLLIRGEASAGWPIETSSPGSVDRLNNFNPPQTFPSTACLRHCRNAKYSAIIVGYSVTKAQLMRGIDFIEVLTGEGFKNLILAHVELLTPVDPDELPKGFSSLADVNYH